MFEKYNEKARRALFFARYEASKLGSRVIESEHILLGILREGEETVSEIFRRFQVKPEDIRREIEGERVFVERISSTAELPLSEESKKILAYASHEAESMLHATVGSEHLLIGILRVEGCTAMRILAQHGFDVYTVREEVLAIAKEREASQQKKELPFLSEYGRDLTSLGATTLKEYRKYIEKDRSLLRRFQAIQVNPPTPEQTQEILEGVKDRYESFHKVRYRAEALRTAIYQSSRYIPDRHLPDKAIDVIDEAGARVKLRRVRDTQNLRRLEQEIRQVVKEMKVAITDKDFERAVYLREREIELREDLERMSLATDQAGVLEVTRHDIEEVISSWTGIPVAALQSEEAERLLRMEEILRQRVIGQDRSISAISRAIRRSRLGVSNPQRPVGPFIFLGPPGVGMN